MRWGFLASAAGIEVEGTAVDEEVVMDQLVQQAALFLRAHGTVSLAEWGTLSHMEREAMARAGDRLAEVHASLVGVASQGPVQAAALAQGLDPDDVKVRLALATAVGHLAKRMAGGEEVLE